jgi:hypothetical protein
MLDWEPSELQCDKGGVSGGAAVNGRVLVKLSSRNVLLMNTGDGRDRKPGESAIGHKLFSDYLK